jgi:hypothetical protein
MSHGVRDGGGWMAQEIGRIAAVEGQRRSEAMLVDVLTQFPQLFFWYPGAGVCGGMDLDAVASVHARASSLMEALRSRPGLRRWRSGSGGRAWGPVMTTGLACAAARKSRGEIRIRRALPTLAWRNEVALDELLTVPRDGSVSRAQLRSASRLSMLGCHGAVACLHSIPVIRQIHCVSGV